MAQEYEEKAAAVFKSTLGPLGSTAHDHSNPKDIERRAYQLWEEAGQPQTKDQEFYLEAERKLKEELIRHELKIPDNL